MTEKAKALYERFLDKDTLDKVEAMDEPDQAYFWAYVYEWAPHTIEKQLLSDLDKAASKVERAKELSATPFKDAEDALRPGAWFRG